MANEAERAPAVPRVAFYNRPRVRSAVWQLAVVAVLLWFGIEFALNAKANLDAQRITSGFGFLDNTAGFGVNQSLIAYSETDSYRRVFLVGLLNTLLVSGLGIVLATIIGFGITRPRLERKKASNSEMLCRGLGSAPSTARYQNRIWNKSGRLRISST